MTLILHRLRASTRPGAIQDTPLDDRWLTPRTIELLDSTFVDSFAAGPRLLELLEERGYVGWTDIRPIG